MQTSGRLWILMARSLNDEATIQEKEELDNILHQSESLQQQYDLLCRVWSDKTARHNNAENPIVNKAISKIITLAELERIQFGDAPKSKKFFRKRRIILASLAVFVIASTVFTWIYTRSSHSIIPRSQETIAVQNGSRSRSMLPDGTTVWLNAGSKLFYDDNFSGATREVRLEGEAFFDVVKQPHRPFIVHTSGIDIKVTGTAFNVKSYPEDKTVETTLYHGSVKVFRHEESEKKAIQLKPNEKLILSKQAANKTSGLSEGVRPTSIKEIPPSFVIAHIDSTKKESERFETAWLYSRLEFRGDSFEELARKLERWYNVTIVFTDENVKQLSFDGSFEKENVEQALAALKEANHLFNYKIKNHEIFVGSIE
jgi:transmembrane sensor